LDHKLWTIFIVFLSRLLYFNLKQCCFIFLLTALVDDKVKLFPDTFHRWFPEKMLNVDAN